VEPRELTWAKQLQAIAQIGITFAQNPFDRERYERVRGVAAEMLAALAGRDGEAASQHIEDVLASLEGYPTPKVDVRALVRGPEGEVLLVHERVDGRWSLPGGWADVGETPSENAVREVAEEAGCVVRAKRLLAVFDRSRHNYPPSVTSVYKLCFACELVSGEPSGGSETFDARWFRLDELPELSTGRTTAEQIRLLAALDADPIRAPYVD
jgi:ADP-ribose pyrophosphatase YjhB (NUDIX family)